jgi:hypothetical protein
VGAHAAAAPVSGEASGTVPPTGGTIAAAGRGLVLPQFEQDQLVGIEDALEYLELFAAGILPRDLATRLHRLREFGALAGASRGT